MDQLSGDGMWAGWLPERSDEWVARLMGTSARMIDRTYGHLARDSEDAIRAKLDACASRSGGEVASNAGDDGGL